MAITNQERVGKAMELLRDGLKPFVEREMERKLGPGWQQVAYDSMPAYSRTGPSMNWDVSAILGVMWEQWNSLPRP